MSRPLLIPSAAMSALLIIARGRNRAVANDIGAIAAPVVAAELRHLADILNATDEQARGEIVAAKNAGNLRDGDMWFGRSIALELAVGVLRARADQLESQEED